MPKKTIEHIALNTRVHFMHDNKVRTGNIERISILVKGSETLITYTIEPNPLNSWEREPNIDVSSELVAESREELIAKL